MNKIFIGPMSKPIVDSILEFDDPAVLIPSRRQVDFNGGYVNNWSTESFAAYVKSKNKNAVICRDHAGASQGQIDDDGYESLSKDCLHFDMIHIDPWKRYMNIEDGLNETVSMIKFCLKINSKIKFEIGTEQSIKFFDTSTLKYFCDKVHAELKKDFDSISHIVIQSGTALQGNNQIGQYDKERLIEMSEIAKLYDKLSKEHNGDYIDLKVIQEKFGLGLDSINIAPEFGFIQTNTILAKLDDEMFETFWKICFDSKKWVKWVNPEFDPFKQKKDLIQICGHYVFSNSDFIENIYNKFDFETDIKKAVKNKIEELNIL
jgi:hypothetical protein